MKMKNLHFACWDTFTKSKAILLILLGVILILSQSCQKEEVTEPVSPTLKSGELTATSTGITIWGPYTVYAGKNYIEGSIPLPPGTGNSYTFYLQIGDGNGVDAPSGVTVEIDGVPLFTTAELRKLKTTISKQLPDKSPVTFKISAKGKSTNYVKVWIEGTISTFKDAALTEYKAVRIGNLVWMAENLKYLPAITFAGQGGYGNSPYYYVYGYTGTDLNEAKANTNYQKYGALYNYDAAVASCPSGWRLPTQADWDDLLKAVGTDPGYQLKSQDSWNGINAYGFNALPAGYIDPALYPQGKEFIGLGPDGLTGFRTDAAESNNMHYTQELYSGNNTFGNSFWEDDKGFSVRYVIGILP